MSPNRRQPLAEILGLLEAEVMSVVWNQGDVSVRDVHRKLNMARPVAYTTVMTTLGRLTDKGLLSRDETQLAHRYFPRVSRDQYERSAVRSVMDWLMSQFGDPALAYFIDRVDKEDHEVIDRIRRAIEELEPKPR